jgi:hypothetical protein
MAATKFGFLTQPNSTVQGYRLTGGASPLANLLGVEDYKATTTASQAIQVACLNADNTLDTTSVVAVTIAIGTNPTSGSTLSGTLTKNAVAGVATFDDLAITLGGVGYTLSATGSLTTATSNAFTLTSVSRINPASLTLTALQATGISRVVGPYRYRPGRSIRGVSISIISTVAADAAQIIAVNPGQTSVASLDPTFNAPVPFLTGAGTALGPLTVPSVINLDSTTLCGACDIYVYPTTSTGVITVTFRRIDQNGGQ